MAEVYAIPFMIIAYSHVLLAIKYEFYIKIMTTNQVALEAKTINLCGINDLNQIIKWYFVPSLELILSHAVAMNGSQ